MTSLLSADGLDVNYIFTDGPHFALF